MWPTLFWYVELSKYYLPNKATAPCDMPAHRDYPPNKLTAPPDMPAPYKTPKITASIRYNYILYMLFRLLPTHCGICYTKSTYEINSMDTLLPDTA